MFAVCFNSTYTNFRVIVIDNAPIIKLQDMLKEELPIVDYIHNRENLGFTGGCNQGIAHGIDAGADFIWLLNNDAIIHKDCLFNLVDMMVNSSNVGLVSPVIKDVRNEKNSYYGTVIYNKADKVRTLFDKDAYLQCSEHDPRSIRLWGTALLIRSELINRIGPLDNDFFAYHEDIEFSHRSVMAGFENKICLSAYIEHDNGHEPLQCRQNYYYFLMARNYYLLWRKTGIPKHEAIRRSLSLFLPKILTYQNKRNLNAVNGYISGIWTGICKKQFGKPPEIIESPFLFKFLILILAKIVR